MNKKNILKYALMVLATIGTIVAVAFVVKLVLCIFANNSAPAP